MWRLVSCGTLVKIFVVDKKCETGLMPQSAALQRVALYGPRLATDDFSGAF